MGALLGISRVIDAVNTAIGRSAMWLTLVAVLVSSINAVVRKAFDMSSNAWLELQWYLFGAVFMLCAGYTLLKNEHIRIDVIASMWSKKTRDWIDVVGHVLVLIPFCLLMIYDLWPFFWGSYRSGEMSPSPGGLIIWPAKGLILLGFILLLAQAVSELIKRIAVIRGDIPDPHEEKHDEDDERVVA
ncbi:TRAP transporter small permease subunit [Hansschlegelia zhihuaiae]|uniref:TRAP transporter small permease protein n=1 Tax=Hansschlegelia zhihuaiae TaxID=405005 RepID=A0A4Q0MLP5_9HYPH|nr:TRAP transporter small permease subunit [Hansschlegelia zhihuaiae]RXF74355.1 TRAP transporter small permease subunit [Hansschlegelia zhihuaiae]